MLEPYVVSLSKISTIFEKVEGPWCMLEPYVCSRPCISTEFEKVEGP